MMRQPFAGDHRERHFFAKRAKIAHRELNKHPLGALKSRTRVKAKSHVYQVFVKKSPGKRENC
jgi:hypothetical protein